ADRGADLHAGARPLSDGHAAILRHALRLRRVLQRPPGRNRHRPPLRQLRFRRPLNWPRRTVGRERLRRPLPSLRWVVRMATNPAIKSLKLLTTKSLSGGSSPRRTARGTLTGRVSGSEEKRRKAKKR